MGRFNRSTCVIAAAIALACGGKTTILDEGVETGSGGAGAGGEDGRGGSVAASGAAGRGGSTGRGGSAGISGSTGSSGSTGRAGSAGRGGSAGSPGFGGSAGIAGGSGGVPTGGTGGVAGGSTKETIDAICSHLERSGCAPPNCRERRQADVDTYGLWGCGEERLETGACLLRDPTPCDVPNEFCVDAHARAQKCIDDAEICVRGNTPEGGCVMGCEGGWAVECKPSSGGVTCVCTSGRNSGRQFMAAACQSDEWLKTIRSNCQ